MGSQAADDGQDALRATLPTREADRGAAELLGCGRGQSATSCFSSTCLLEGRARAVLGEDMDVGEAPLLQEATAYELNVDVIPQEPGFMFNIFWAK